MPLETQIRKINYRKQPGNLAAVSFLVKAGARYETENSNGIAHLLEHLISLGGKKFSSQVAFYQELETLGAHFAARTSYEYTEYSLTAPFDNLEKALGLLFKSLKYPNFSEKNLEHEKAIILEEFYFYLEKNQKGKIIDPWYNMQQLLWPENSLSFNILGKPANLKRFNQKALRDYFKKWYAEQNYAIGIAAPQLTPELQSKLAKFSLKHGQPQPTPRFKKSKQKAPVFKFIPADKDKALVRLGFLGVGYNNSRSYLLQLLVSAILGEGSGSVLAMRLREERGLVYSIWSSPSSYTNTGCITIGFDCSPQKTIPALQELLKTIKSFKKQPVKPATLTRAQGYLKGEITADESRPEQVSFRLAQDALFGYSLSPSQEIKQLYRFTPQAAQKYAQAIFTPQNLKFLLISPDANKYQQTIHDLVQETL